MDKVRRNYRFVNCVCDVCVYGGDGLNINTPPAPLFRGEKKTHPRSLLIEGRLEVPSIKRGFRGVF